MLHHVVISVMSDTHALNAQHCTKQQRAQKGRGKQMQGMGFRQRCMRVVMAVISDPHTLNAQHCTKESIEGAGGGEGESKGRSYDSAA